MAIIFKGNKIAGVGDPGKTGESAYEIALKNGYEGSEEQFAQELNDVVNIKNHLEEELTKKSDVGHDHNGMYYTEAEIDDKFASIPTPDVSGQIENHNIDENAHNDIRQAIENKMNKENPVGTGSFSLNRKSTGIIGDLSFAEGSYTTASGRASHAEGSSTIASNEAAHAEGIVTQATGKASHAEGNSTIASGEESHAEGYKTESEGKRSHAEGYETKASGENAHAEGYRTIAKGNNSHAEGLGTEARGEAQHVQGLYNIITSTLLHIVGNGGPDVRSNAHTLDWDGNAWFAGDVYVGSTSGKNKDEGSKKLATEEYVDDATTTVKNDLLNGAGDAYDTLKELGTLIDENADAIDALREVATNKANTTDVYTKTEINTIVNNHNINPNSHEDIRNTLQAEIDSKPFGYRISSYTNLVTISGNINNNRYGIRYISNSGPQIVPGQTYRATLSDNRTYTIKAATNSANGRPCLGAAINPTYEPILYDIFVEYYDGMLYVYYKNSVTPSNTLKLETVNIVKTIIPNDLLPTSVNQSVNATNATNATNLKSSPSTAKAYILGTTTTGSATNKATVYNASVYTEGSVLYGAAWNDYAEYRIADCHEPGRVICENGDDTLSLATERLQPGANVISDTFGFAIGETEEAKTPIAVSGRVLVYTYENRNSYAPGDAVCAAPNGTVSLMTREEIMMYPERIVGTVSAIPTYETWGEKNVAVNDRIWIKVK